MQVGVGAFAVIRLVEAAFLAALVGAEADGDLGDAERDGRCDAAPCDGDEDGNRLPLKMWVATNYPNAEKLMEAQNKMAATMPGGKDMIVKGITVKTVMDAAGQKITTELVSAKQEAVADSEFAVPKDYKEMILPE